MENLVCLNPISETTVVNKIYTIRTQKVMLDSDLAELYGVPTKRINEQVKRNIERFPEDFMFQLIENEWNHLRSQIATSSEDNKWGGRRILPYCFTEHGVLMLSSVLTSKIAIQVNIELMRVFSKLRNALTENNSIQKELQLIKSQLENHDADIVQIFNYLEALTVTSEKNKERRQIGF